MSIITLDFETYYDKDYTLSKLTTEEYVNHDLFEIIGVSVKIDDGPAEWYTDTNILGTFQWKDHAVLCHNALFDGFILAKLGYHPGFFFDTLCMARALHGTSVGGSLAALVERYQLGRKGDEVTRAAGKHQKNFSIEELASYGEYCKNDVELTYKLFHALQTYNHFPDEDLQLIDITIKMFTDPVFKVDSLLLEEKLTEVRKHKKEILQNLAAEFHVVNEEQVRKILASNNLFAEVLTRHNVDPPKKISLVTGKEAFAFAKTDEEFLALQEHDNPVIQQICAARLGIKSTLEETRIERFIGIGNRNNGYLPIPLKYYGAHTGRWSGMDSVNFHNLPARDKSKKTLKTGITAPSGFFVVNADSSQIEARILAWLANQQDILELFQKGEDIYCHDASLVFGRPITSKDETERFVGKTMRLGLGYGTGATKLQSVLKAGGAIYDLEKCRHFVNSWRETNYRIRGLWSDCSYILAQMANIDDILGVVPIKESFYVQIGRKGIVYLTADGIKLPNGLHIRYNKLRVDNYQYIYSPGRGGKDIKKIWGGAVVENITQALAKIVIGHQMIKVAKKYRVGLTVHDSIVCLVPETEIQEALEYVKMCLSTPPDWAKTLPVACKVTYGRTYGDC